MMIGLFLQPSPGKSQGWGRAPPWGSSAAKSGRISQPSISQQISLTSFFVVGKLSGKCIVTSSSPSSQKLELPPSHYCPHFLLLSLLSLRQWADVKGTQQSSTAPCRNDHHRSFPVGNLPIHWSWNKLTTSAELLSKLFHYKNSHHPYWFNFK